MAGSSRTPGARRARAAAAAAALLLGAWLAPAAFAAEPRFPIDRITVEGARHASAELIVAESLLAAGRSYGEDELRQAVYRIQRLPFVIDTSFALRRGSERGSYELVITVEETSLLFFGLDVDSAIFHSSLDGTTWEGRGEGTAGARWFAGEHGVLFGAVEGDEARIGYSHYDLFGRRIFASFSYGRGWSGHDGLLFQWDRDGARGGSPEDLDGDGESFALLTGFPLTIYQSVRFSASSTEIEPEPDRPFSGGLEPDPHRARIADVQWIYDSTDEPILPTRGRLVNAGIVARKESFRVLTPGFEPPPALDPFELLPTRQELESVALVVGFRHYRPLSSRQVIWGSAQAALDRATLEERVEDPVREREQSTTGTLLEIGGGWAVRLWEPGRRPEIGDLRFETTFRVRYSEDGLDPFGDDGFSGDAGIGFVLRNRWGLFRFGFGVEELSGGD